MALLRGVGDADVRMALRAQLIRRPLATEFEEPGPIVPSEEPLAGLRVLCVDALIRVANESGRKIRKI